MKRMYKQPETEIAAFKTARLMDGLTTSDGGVDNSNEAHAPAHHSTALPVPGGAL
jgi:hypothetical protein